MSRSINSLLKSHPISLKENLVRISRALGMEIDMEKARKAQMQNDIEECLKTYPEYEQAVRDVMDEILNEFNLQKLSIN